MRWDLIMMRRDGMLSHPVLATHEPHSSAVASFHGSMSGWPTHTSIQPAIHPSFQNLFMQYWGSDMGSSINWKRKCISFSLINLRRNCFSSRISLLHIFGGGLLCYYLTLSQCLHQSNTQENCTLPTVLLPRWHSTLLILHSVG